MCCLSLFLTQFGPNSTHGKLPLQCQRDSNPYKIDHKSDTSHLYLIKYQYIFKELSTPWSYHNSKYTDFITENYDVSKVGSPSLFIEVIPCTICFLCTAKIFYHHDVPYASRDAAL